MRGAIKRSTFGQVVDRRALAIKIVMHPLRQYGRDAIRFASPLALSRLSILALIFTLSCNIIGFCAT